MKKSLKGNIVDVVRKRIFKGEIIISEGKIIDIIEKPVSEEFYFLPGLIDAHVHIESSMLVPSEFAKVAVLHGTVAAVSDPHEIANVCGISGIDYMINNGKTVPFKFFFGAPSCVPATSFETSGAIIDAKDIESLIKRKDIFFLAEMMNFPGVINGDKEVRKKIQAAKKYKKRIDGHAPGISGTNLHKYSGAGITTDHECVNKYEALEKIKAGMKIQIREGSAAKNFESLFELIEEYPDDVMLCTDDTHPNDLLVDHIRRLIKMGIKKNIDIFKLLRAATYNVVKHYNLPVGLLQKGNPADFIVVDNLNAFTVLQTYIDGRLVAEKGRALFNTKKAKVINNFKTGKLMLKDIAAESNNRKTKVIEVIDGELITRMTERNLPVINGQLQPDVPNDILKIVVVNRYKKERPIIGFVKNFNLKKGAIASSIAHDSHNIVVVGTCDKDIVKAVNTIVENKGGICACHNNEVVTLRLPVGGLMSTDNARAVAAQYEKVHGKALEYGSNLISPFMTMAFMTLLVIPAIKIGDKGIMDVNKFQYIIMTIEDIKKSIRNVPDFPKKGIMFKDLSTAFKDKDVIRFMADEIFNYYKDKKITKVVGIESRGFILGSALAYKLRAGFIPLRKPGKLPAAVFSKTYDLEYGQDTLEIHRDAISPNDVVLIHDDLLATGGTAQAAFELVKMFNVKDIYINFIVELTFLDGIKRFKKPENVFSLVKF
ncbi:MAG: adenine deaminase [Bacteroidia bacterium]|nr:adenine deaminase [Bacteroidia bacterium]